jgi:hypothetical protein
MVENLAQDLLEKLLSKTPTSTTICDDLRAEVSTSDPNLYTRKIYLASPILAREIDLRHLCLK